MRSTTIAPWLAFLALFGIIGKGVALPSCSELQTTHSDWHHCFGIYTRADGSEHAGEWAYGKPHGHGTHTWPNGSSYVGEWAEGKRHGQGTYTWPNGSAYVGRFRTNKRHGRGTYTKADGSNYVGEWTDDKRHGQGSFTDTDGSTYVGEWADGEQQGRGTYTRTDGSKYAGEWAGGKQHGQGTYAWPDGSKYVGQWAENKRDGEGVLTWPNRSRYVGEWMDGKRHGQGTFTKADGSSYVGEWADDKRHGQGTLKSPNGPDYAGQWAAGKRHGPGAVTRADGTITRGTWEAGEWTARRTTPSYQPGTKETYRRGASGNEPTPKARDVKRTKRSQATAPTMAGTIAPLAIAGFVGWFVATRRRNIWFSMSGVLAGVVVGAFVSPFFATELFEITAESKRSLMVQSAWISLFAALAGAWFLPSLSKRWNVQLARTTPAIASLGEHGEPVAQPHTTSDIEPSTQSDASLVDTRTVSLGAMYPFPHGDGAISGNVDRVYTDPSGYAQVVITVTNKAETDVTAVVVECTWLQSGQARVVEKSAVTRLSSGQSGLAQVSAGERFTYDGVRCRIISAS